MPDSVLEKAKLLAGSWTAYTALGSFFLYLFGYLSLRFQLYAMGIKTDLAVFDERYLFAGASYLVFLVSSVPIIVLLVLVLIVMVYLPYLVLPESFRQLLGASLDRRWQPIRTWWLVPPRLALAGIVLSVLMIQLVMRQCLFFSNLLLRHALPQPEWLQAILLNDFGDSGDPVYFSALLAVTILAGGILVVVSRPQGPDVAPRPLTALLAFLVAVQFLLLPINYGILIAGKQLPKVSDLGGQIPLAQGDEAWLVWEGTEGKTYLVRSRTGARTLVTLPKKVIDRVQITCYVQIFRVLFLNESRPDCTDRKGSL